jgi:hypothetical protein
MHSETLFLKYFDGSQFLKILFLLFVLFWGYTVIFTKVLIIYQIYSSWIHLLHDLPSSLPPPCILRYLVNLKIWLCWDSEHDTAKYDTLGNCKGRQSLWPSLRKEFSDPPQLKVSQKTSFQRVLSYSQRPRRIRKDKNFNSLAPSILPLDRRSNPFCPIASHQKCSLISL